MFSPMALLSGASVVGELELWLVVSASRRAVGLWVIEQPEVAQHGMNGVGVVHPGDDTEPSLAESARQDVHEEDPAQRNSSYNMPFAIKKPQISTPSVSVYKYECF